jgi:hypothetical protein
MLDSSRTSSWNPWTTLLCCVAVFCFLASQIVAQLQVQTSLRNQVANLAALSSKLDSDILRAKAVEGEQARLLERADQVSDTYNRLFRDLLSLSESDRDALAVVAKFQIQRQSAPPAASP